MLLTGLLSLPLYGTKNYQPGDGPTNNGLGPSSPSITKKMPYRLTYSPAPSSGGIFSVERPPL